MFGSPEETLVNLERVGYFTDRKTATTVFLAGRIHRPVMLEGPAGAGKTQLAQSVAQAYGAPLLRLQCYQGISEEKAIGQFDKSLQELYVLLMSKSSQTPDWGKSSVKSRAGRSSWRARCSRQSSRNSRACSSSMKSIRLTMRSKQCSSNSCLPGRSRSRSLGRSMRPRFPTFFSPQIRSAG